MSTEIETRVALVAAEAKRASRILGIASTKTKNAALGALAELIVKEKNQILAANALDLQAAQASSMAPAMLDRLRLDEKRIEAMARGVMEVAALPDPVAKVIEEIQRPNGLRIRKTRTPLGVVGIIYESRPNVTIDAASLCLKAGNACVLRGGSESLRSNVVLGMFLRQALASVGLPEACVTVIDIADRSAVTALLKLDKYLDVIIPRGGHGLIRFVIENSTIPVIRHDIGNCHVFVDASADLAMAEEIAFNAKVQRPGVCNAMEHLLVHKAVAGDFLPRIFERYRAAGVELRGDEATRKIDSAVKAVAKDEWSSEYLDLIVGVKVVENLSEAIEHINEFGSGHSDAIVTKDLAQGARFQREVDSAAVYVNASTRFTDGSEFGLGAEIGISTQKLHARGPMALEELTCIKWVINGDGQVRT